MMRKWYIFAFALILGTSMIDSVASAQARPKGQMQGIRASEILGETVYSKDNQPIGEVQKIYIDRHRGDISSISVDVSGYMKGKKNLCKIPWEKVSIDQGTLVVDMDVKSMDRLCPMKSKSKKGDSEYLYQKEYDQRRYQRNPRYEEEMGIEYEEDPQMQDLQKQDQQMQQGQEADLPGSRLLGAQVYNRNNEEIGEIEEVLIDRKTGKVDGVIIGVGGFLGMGESSCRVSLKDMTNEKGQLVVDLEEDRGAACPYGDEWSEDEYYDEYGIGME